MKKVSPGGPDNGEAKHIRQKNLDSAGHTALQTGTKEAMTFMPDWDSMKPSLSEYGIPEKTKGPAGKIAA